MSYTYCIYHIIYMKGFMRAFYHPVVNFSLVIFCSNLIKIINIYWNMVKHIGIYCNISRKRLHSKRVKGIYQWFYLSKLLVV